MINLLELEWWVYLIIVLSFFLICLGLNYIVKKMNEAKIDERIIRMLHKASTTQSTQVNGPLMVTETGKVINRQNYSRTAQLSPTGISFVFNQEENKRRKDLEDTFNIIKKSMESRKFDALSLNTNKSVDTIDTLPLVLSDHKISENEPPKMIQTGRLTAKETASSKHSELNLTEIVIVKKNDFGNNASKEGPSNNKSDSFVTKIISVKKREFEYVPVIGTSSIIPNDCNISKIDENIKSKSPLGKETSSHNQSNSKNTKKEISFKKTASITEYGCNEKDETSPNERLDSNVREIVSNKNEIGYFSFIKRAVDSTVSMIFKQSKTYDLKTEKGSTAKVAANVPSSHSRSNIEEVISMRKSEMEGTVAAVSSISNLNEGASAEKLDTENSAAKASSSHSQGNSLISVLSLDEIIESERIVTKTASNLIQVNTNLKGEIINNSGTARSSSAKVTSSRRRSDSKITSLGSIKMNDSGRIVSKEISSITQSNRNVTQTSSVKSESRLKATEEISYNTISNQNYDDIVSLNISASTNKSGRIQSEETTSNERSNSLRRLSEYLLSQKNMSDRFATETNYHEISQKDSKVISAINKTNDDVGSSYFLLKKSVDSTVPKVAIANTSTAANEDAKTKRGFKDRIKALLAPPVLNEDIMILKPGSSSKK